MLYSVFVEEVVPEKQDGGKRKKIEYKQHVVTQAAASPKSVATCAGPGPKIRVRCVLVTQSCLILLQPCGL